VDFVEIEQAWHHVLWDDAAKSKFQPPWWRKSWLRWRGWRCAAAGIEYLNWASSLKIDESMGVNPGDNHYGAPTYQAKAAKEILALYAWWTVTYRNRPDPYDASGWTAYCEASRAANNGQLSWDGNKDSAELRKMCNRALRALSQIEAQYEKEDEQMMIRLIKIRQSLWT
jgi:hypothetical protein